MGNACEVRSEPHEKHEKRPLTVQSPNFSWLEWTVALERTRYFEILARLENPDVNPAADGVGQRPITRSFAKPLSRLAIGTVHE